MAIIVDKRDVSSSKESGNRTKLNRRCRKGLSDEVHQKIDQRDIKDATKTIRVPPPQGVLDEPSFAADPQTGNAPIVVRNNREYQKGDKMFVPAGSKTKSKASDEFEDFVFVLGKKEILEILFEDMALPAFIKKAFNTEEKFILAKHGTSTEGPMPQLNLLKTMITAIGRRLALRKSYQERDPPEKPPFLTDEDLRFDVYTETPIPVEKAVMFAVMDVSGSMGDHERFLAKRFFLLLYLFLSREYESVDIRFIIHSTEAAEVDEEDFFNSEASGGTIVRSAFELINDIIAKDYEDLSTVNLYVAQVSDGDDFQEGAGLADYITKQIVPKIQYMAYLQVLPESTFSSHRELGGLYSTYKRYLGGEKSKVNIGVAQSLEQVFPVLKNLFKKEE